MIQMKRSTSPVSRNNFSLKTLLKGVLKAPTYTDPQEQFLAQTLHSLLIFTSLVSGSYAVLTWFISDEPSGTILSGSMAFVSAFLLQILRRGHIQFVSRLLIISGYVVIMTTLFMNGGLRDEAALVLMALLSIAGFLLGMQVVVPLGIVTAVMLIVLYVGEILEIIPETEHFLPVAADEFMMALISTFVTTVVLYQITRQMSRNTDQIAIQAKFLSEQNKQLEETQQALILAKEQAEEANRSRSDFFSRMSHDLRTPLSGILGMVHHLLNDGAQIPSASQEEFLQAIDRSGTHLLNLINNLLDIARLEAHQLKLHMAPTFLAGTLGEIIMMLRLSAEDKGIQLRLHLDDNVPEVVLADEQRLQQILINLVGNGIKFTQSGEVALLVTAVSVETAVSSIRFEIADTGCGIAPHKVEQIFDPFVQVTERPSQTPGTGLGLAICRQLVEKMGGTLQVESILGQGSRFWFILQLENAPPS